MRGLQLLLALLLTSAAGCGGSVPYVLLQQCASSSLSREDYTPAGVTIPSSPTASRCVFGKFLTSTTLNVFWNKHYIDIRYKTGMLSPTEDEDLAACLMACR